MVARGGDQIHNIFFDQIVHIDRAHRSLRFHQFLDRDHLLHILNRMVFRLAVEHIDFVIFHGIAQANAHHKAINLRFRQGKGAFVLDGILGGQDHKGPCHGVGHAINRDLAFFHSFQQRSLRFRRSPVNFIG